MNAVGLANRPRTMRMPPMTSIQAPIQICDNAASGGIGIGLEGKPNSFIDPAVMKINPATTRATASTRSGQGCLAGSKIDIWDSIVFHSRDTAAEPNQTCHPERRHPRPAVSPRIFRAARDLDDLR